jgi:hypothetical protein
MFVDVANLDKINAGLSVSGDAQTSSVISLPSFFNWLGGRREMRYAP